MTNLTQIPPEQIDAAFKGTNFGDGMTTGDHHQLLLNSVLKVALGYHCGHTITQIMKRMGLIEEIRPEKYKVTPQGRVVCYDHFSLDKSG